VRSTPVLPPALEAPGHPTPSHVAPSRFAQEKRTISGTQLAQRFRDDAEEDVK